MPKSDDSGVDLDSILLEIGQFGRYQLTNYCFLLIPIIFSAIYNGQYVFNAASVPYRCKVPECESSPPEFSTGSWGQWALPQDPVRASCERYVPTETLTCSQEGFYQNVTTNCDAWVYESHNSVVATFDLACEEWKRTLVGTIHYAGLFTALPLTGYVSDTWGRRRTFIITAVAVSVVGVIRSFSVNYIMYLVLEFLDAAVAAGVFNTGYILALEMVGLKHRVLAGNLISCSYAMGSVILSLIAWGVPEWRTLTRILYAPSILFILYYFIIEESVRWLLSKGYKKEAARIIFKASQMNKKKISPQYIEQLTVETKTEKVQDVAKDEKEKPIVLQVLHSKIILCRLFICSFWWITLTFIYYGLSINSVSLGGNSNFNFILMSLVEIPGYILSVLTLDRFGRKRCIMTAFFICGISLVSLPFIPKSLNWLTTALNMLGKLCISMTFSSVYIYTSELFPTTARHSLLGFCSMVGRIGSIVAPQTPLLMTYMASLPYLLFGSMAATSGLLMSLTPETLSIKLPDTIAQAENLALLEVSSNSDKIDVA